MRGGAGAGAGGCGLRLRATAAAAPAAVTAAAAIRRLRVAARRDLELMAPLWHTGRVSAAGPSWRTGATAPTCGITG